MTLVCGKVGKRALMPSPLGAMKALDAALHADRKLTLNSFFDRSFLQKSE
jgi:hypothetical protein